MTLKMSSSLLAPFALFLLLFAASECVAQEQTGTIEGHVLDVSGALITDAVITATSPAVLGGSRSVHTDGTGEYRLSQLPVGAYDISIAHPGFATELHKDVEIHAATTFTVNGTLMASSTDQVEVVGTTPQIETAQTDVNFTFTKQNLENIPNARDPWAMLSQVPGVATDTVNVGGTQTGSQPTFRGHGVDPTQNTYLLNGANVTDNTANGGSQLYFDVDSFDEMQIQINSHGADVQTPGMVMNIVPKSGSNQIHGMVSSYFSSQGMQTNNLTSQLRAIGGTSSSLHQYLDYGGNVGGPILKDKIWYFGAYRYQAIQKLITGTTGANGSAPIDKFHLWFPDAKVNWQINKSNNFSFFLALFQKVHNNNGLSALRPLVTTWNQQEDPIGRLFTFRDDYTVNSRFILTAKVFIMNQGFEYLPPSGVDTETTPTAIDNATGITSLAPPYLYGISKTLRTYGASGTYLAPKFAGGSHELKFGGDYTHYRVYGNQQLNGGTALMTYPDDTQLQFLNGVAQYVVQYAPSTEDVSEPTYNLYLQDGYNYKRLRLDLGLRWDWQANSLNDVTAPKSQFLPAVHQIGTGNLVTWNTFAPRIGVIYDVTGKAKTLVKGSYNRYYYQLWTTIGQAASTAGVRSYKYVWTDLNHDNRFETGEAGALISKTDPSTTPVSIDPGIKATHTDEWTAGVSQELFSNIAVNAEFIYRRDSDIPWAINTNVGPSDYTAVIGTDPGPDGKLGTKDDGGQLTFYNLAAAKVGQSNNLEQTRPGFTQEYKGFEIELIRRFQHNFQLVGSYTRGVESENYGQGSYRTPQDINFMNKTRIPSSRPNIAKISGSYKLRHGFMASGSYQFLSGPNYTRTLNSSTAGVVLNQGNVAVLSGPRDAQSYPGQNLLDFRIGYEKTIHERLRFNVDFDTFNTLNVNTIDSLNTLSGSAFGQLIDYIPPRLFRIGGKMSF